MFQVSGAWTLIITRGNVDVESESDKSDCEDMPLLEDCTKDDLHYLWRSPWI